MSRRRSGIALISSLGIHCALGALLLDSLHSSDSRVFVEVGGIEIQTSKRPERTTEKVTASNEAAPVHDSKPETIPTGATGATGTRSGTSSNLQPSAEVLNIYFSQIRERISRSIHPPHARLFSSLKTTLRLTISETGKVKGREIEQSSGSAEFDRAILAALDDASPFPPFTHEMAEFHEVTLKLPIEIRPQR